MLAKTGDRKSIAVLPFENVSSDQENEHFADGLHDELLTKLAKIHDLKVISRTSVMEYKDRTRNLRDIGLRRDQIEAAVRRQTFLR